MAWLCSRADASKDVTARLERVDSATARACTVIIIVTLIIHAAGVFVRALSNLTSTSFRDRNCFAVRSADGFAALSLPLFCLANCAFREMYCSILSQSGR